MIEKNTFKNLLIKDFWWKILSMLIAICLWFIVINIENPVEIRSFSVPLEIRGINEVTDSNQIISNYDDIDDMKITIKVRGQRLSLDKLHQNRDAIQTYVDLSLIENIPISGGTFTVPILVKLPANLSDSYEIESRAPSSIQVVIEERKEVEMAVELLIEGSSVGSYVMVDPEIDPSSVMVSGTESAVNAVVGVRAVIQVENIVEDSHYVARLVPYNENDVEVFDVTLSQDVANIYIPVKASKKVQLVPEVIGVPKEGFVLSEITCYPQSVYILGDEALLASITEIAVPAMNIDGKSSDTETSFVIRYILPDGIRLKEGEAERIVIKATFVKESAKDVVLKSENIFFTIELAEGYIAEVLPENIPIRISGLETVLNNISDEDITADAVIRNLEAGEHRLPILVNLPEGARLTEVESPYITVVIVEKIEEVQENQDISNV